MSTTLPLASRLRPTLEYSGDTITIERLPVADGGLIVASRRTDGELVTVHPVPDGLTPADWASSIAAEYPGWTVTPEGHLVHGERTIILRMPDSSPSFPMSGGRQWWGWAAEADQAAEGRGLLRLELPDGAVIEGPGRYRPSRGGCLKVFIFDDAERGQQ